MPKKKATVETTVLNERNPGCEMCGLCESSKNVCIWGDGTGEAFVVGEAPGREEASTGKPFMGASGKLLRKLLAEVGLEDAYITNAAKCRPPDNRKPEASELKSCKPYLLGEIENRKPRAILLLGAVATKALIGKASITQMNAQMVEKSGRVYVCAFHPAYVLRDPSKEDALRIAIERYAAVLNGTFDDTLPPFRLIERDSIDGFIQDWIRAERVSFDVEATGLDWFAPDFKVNSIAFTLSDHAGTYENSWAMGLNLHAVLPFELQRELLHELANTSAGKYIVGQNPKYDNLALMAYFGMKFRVSSDTVLAHHLLDENSVHGLKQRAREDLGAPDYDLTVPEKTGAKWVPARKYLQYNANDTMYTERLDRKYIPRMDEEEEWLYRKVIMPAARAFEGIDRNGLYVDVSKLDETEESERKELLSVKAELNALARTVTKRKINWGSPSQVGRFFYDDLGLEPTVLTPKGKPSTAELALIDIEHPVSGLLARYRMKEKFLSTYIGKWNDETGTYEGGWRDFMVGPYLYLGHKLSGTVTGRYSSRLHQVPRDGTVRNLFTAPPGWVKVVLDLSQAELRFIAIDSRDPQLLHCYQNGIDVHWSTLVGVIETNGGKYVDLALQTAKTLSGHRDWSFDECIQYLKTITPEEAINFNSGWKEGRKEAKGINFGFVYGQKEFGFITYAKKTYGMDVTLEESTNYRAGFMNTYRRIESWQERKKKLARADGFVKNFYGRKRHLPGIYSHDHSVRAEAERQAVNAPVQGGIGDHKAMIVIEIDETFPKEQLRIVGEVHDSVLMWIKEEHIMHILPELHYIAEHPRLAKEYGVDYPITIAVDMEVGVWGKGIPWQKYLKGERRAN